MKSTILYVFISVLIALCIIGCDRKHFTGDGYGIRGQSKLLVDDTLKPAVITEFVPFDSDDPAIWIHPSDPTQSMVIGTDKHPTAGGLFAFNLNGEILHKRNVTGLNRPNNVDVAYGFRLKNRPVDIAVLTERNSMMIRVFSLPDMQPIDDGGIPVFDGDSTRAPMGIAIYKRPHDGEVFAIISGKSGPEKGYLRQYLLEDDGSGQVRGTKVREFGKYSGEKEIEAIAVDNQLGFVYYSDEEVGIRKYYADPDSSNDELAFFGKSGFVNDHEGIAIYTFDDETGYILISDQGGDRLQIFPREGLPGSPHDHPVIAIIPVSAKDTDGIEVTSIPLGTMYPSGMLVMMSSDRTYHYYNWEDVAHLMKPNTGEKTPSYER